MQNSESDHREPECCEVCRSNRFNNNVFQKLVCKQCQRTVHRFCYAPDFRDKKNFKCDECKKDLQGRCTVCRKDNGILKEIGDGVWAHVICGLFSPRVKVSSYRSLELKLSKNGERTREFQADKQCVICHHRSTEVFPCWSRQCKNYAHVGCIVGFLFKPSEQCYLTMGLLDKHSQTLLYHLQSYSQRFYSFRFLKKKRFKPFVCNTHNDDPNFIFCTCGKSKLKEDKQQVKQVSCDSCKRWFHLECTEVKNLSLDYECSGCKQNNLFRKLVQLPELIEKLGEIESVGRLDKKNIKILDSVILKMSSTLYNLCLDRRGCEQIDRFYFQKMLDRLSREDKQSGKDKNFNYRSRESTVLEVLHFLIKNQYSQSRKISEQTERELLDYLKSSRVSMGVGPDAFSRSRKFLEDRMNFFKESSKELEHIRQDLMSQINGFITILETKGPFTTAVLSKETYRFLNALHSSEIARQVFGGLKINNKSSPLLLQILFRSKLKEQQFSIIFSRYRNVVSLQSKRTISQTQVCDLLTWYDPDFQYLSSSKKEQLGQLFKNKIKGFNIVYDYQEHESTLSKALSKIAAGVSSRETCLIRNNLVKKLLFLAAGSPICVSDYTEIYYSIRKVKTLKAIASPLREELNNLLQEIKALLRDPACNSKLTKTERQDLQNFLNRSNFYMKLVTFHGKNKGIKGFSGIAQPENELQFDSMCVVGGFQSLLKMASQAMSNWDFATAASTEFALKLLSEFPVEEMQLSQSEAAELNEFSSRVLQSICKSRGDYPGLLDPTLLREIYILLTRLKQLQLYPTFKQWYEKYDNWKKDLQKFKEVEVALQNLEDVEDILVLVDSKIQTAQGIKLDLMVEIRKLKVLKVWAKASKKMLLDKKNGINFTIISVQQMKSNLEKIRYPSNYLKRTVDRLDQQARNIEKRMKQFEKSKIVRDEELWVELHQISRRPRKVEGEEYLKKLGSSKLDVFFSQVDLETVLSEYDNIPQNLREWVDQQSSSMVLEKMRRMIMESPFRINSLQDYDYLYKKIYFLKCQQPVDSMNQKQYNRMLSYGGIGIPKLIDSTLNLFNAYRQIETAKKEVLQLRPNQSKLLPTDGKKLMSDLREDQLQSQTVGALYLNAQGLQERLNELKLSFMGWQKYVELISDITRQPVALTNLALRIVGMKRVLDQCLQKANLIKIGQSNHLFCAESTMILQKYKQNGIKHPQMQRFQVLYYRYSKVCDIQKRLSTRTYPEFSRMCEEYQEISRNINIRQMREEAFRTIYPFYVQAPNNFKEVGETLLREGGYLCQKSILAKQIVPKLMNITRMLFGIAVTPPGRLDVVSEGSVSSVNDSDKAVRSVSESSNPMLNIDQNSDNASRVAKCGNSCSSHEQGFVPEFKGE